MTPDDERFDVSDDALGTMLWARADRVPPGASDAVRARVHADLHERGPGGILAFLPIGDRAGALSGWTGWGVALAAAVLVIAVLGGRQTADPAATNPPSGSPDPSARASLEAELGETLERLELAAFALAVADGSLDDRIVLVNGALRGGTTACTATRCDPFWFEGLENIPVVWTGPAPEPELGYPPSTPVPGAYDWWDGPFLVRPGDGRLELLGYLAGILDRPVTVQAALVDQRGYPNASSPFDILPISGYLLSCPPTASCVRSNDRLADVRPRQLGTGGEGSVTVLDPWPELDATGVAQGPFLVRFQPVARACVRLMQCTSQGWGEHPTVIGQYRAGDVVQVDLPALTTAEP